MNLDIWTLKSKESSSRLFVALTEWKKTRGIQIPDSVWRPILKNFHWNSQISLKSCIFGLDFDMKSWKNGSVLSDTGQLRTFCWIPKNKIHLFVIKSLDSHPFTFTVCAHVFDRIGDRQEVYAEKILPLNQRLNSWEVLLMCPETLRLKASWKCVGGVAWTNWVVDRIINYLKG